MIINLLMGADARENRVNRGEMNPLHSLPGLDFLCCLGFSFRAMAHVWYGLWASFSKTLSLFLYVLFFLASWCALVTVPSCDCTPGLLNILFYVTFPFNLVY